VALRDWLSRALNRRSDNQKTDSLELFREVYGGWGSVWANKDVSLTTTLQVATALACGRVIAECIALLPWKVMQRAGREIAPATQHPLYDKLAIEPNPLQTAFEFQETMGLHLAFTNNAYVWAPTVAGRIDALWLLEPGWVTCKHRWPDLPTYEIRVDDGRTLSLTSNDVWHVRGPSWSSYVGLPFMQLARQALGLSMALEEGQARLQTNGVRMPGYLSVEGSLADDQHKKLMGWLEKYHTGTENAGRPMVLDRAAKWLATAMSNVDAQLLEQRRFAVEEVCRFMRVLPIMVGHTDKTASYASSEQMFLAHSMYTAAPWARRLEQSADKRLIGKADRARGYYSKLNEKAMLRMTARDQAEFLARMVLSGIYVRNEAREVMDLNPLPGLDEPLAPANTFAGNPPAPTDPAAGDGKTTGSSEGDAE
jgi:HK97 family phage portal protein